MTPGVSYSRTTRRTAPWLFALLLLFAVRTAAQTQENSAGAAGQNTSPAQANSPAPTTKESAAAQPAAAKPSNETKPEVSSKDTAPTFKLRVNVIQVRVVVRDNKGNPVEGLKREDFQLYDQGKLQMVSTFGVETSKSRLQRAEAEAKTQQGDEGIPVEAKVALPHRFVALVFDDIHLKMTDANVVRSSAGALIDSLSPTDRMAIYGTSGQVGQEFTSDHEALKKTLLQIVPRPKMGTISEVSDCPNVNHYMADQFINKADQQVFSVVTQEVLQCQFNNDSRMLAGAQTLATIALEQALRAGDTDNEFTYRELEDVLRCLSTLPGERVLVLASPGFLLTTQYLDESALIDRANRAGVVINTLDARGLYAPDVMGDISARNTDTVLTAGYKATYRTQEQVEDAFVLADVAYGTGGTFFHNSNDLAAGLKRAGEAPAVCYVLGFSPQNQKMDGRFHSIKVTLTSKQKYDIQARRGYYAPKKVDDPKEQAKQEIAEAVFSQEEIHELPLDLQTQYFKSGEDEAHLSVVSRIDVKGVHFRKAEGRNWDELTVATAIFDENGNYVTGGEKLLEMRLLDTTYARLSQTGLMMKSSFDLKPGKYMVRQVIRDSEGAQMAARNGAVVIPY